LISRWVLPLVLFCLAACTSISHVPDDERWSFDGKVSLRQAGQTRLFSVVWDKYPDRSEIRLSAALGAASADLTLAEGRVRVQSGDIDETYPDGGSIDLAGQSVPLPLRYLEYWLRGYQNASGQPITGDFLLDGWQVSILKSDESGPRLLMMTHQDVSLRLRIKRWQFPVEASRVDSI
jgi:outer membrane biogenesis lipoprotein LolB